MRSNAETRIDVSIVQNSREMNWRALQEAWMNGDSFVEVHNIQLIIIIQKKKKKKKKKKKVHN
jgi:hypothetical protein